jgi:hypothetical protein
MCNQPRETSITVPVTDDLATAIAHIAKSDFTTKAGLIRSIVVAELPRRGYALKGDKAVTA